VEAGRDQAEDPRMFPLGEAAAAYHFILDCKNTIAPRVSTLTIAREIEGKK
jgi:hypothetical protein